MQRVLVLLVGQPCRITSRPWLTPTLEGNNDSGAGVDAVILWLSLGFNLSALLTFLHQWFHEDIAVFWSLRLSFQVRVTVLGETCWGLILILIVFCCDRFLFLFFACLFKVVEPVYTFDVDLCWNGIHFLILICLRVIHFGKGWFNRLLCLSTNSAFYLIIDIY